MGREDLSGQQFAPAVNGNRVYDDLCALFRSYTREQWAAMLFGVETCCELVYSLEEALNSQPMRALGMLTDDHILPAVRLSERSVPTPATAPALGEHTNELLAGLGCTRDQISALKERGVV